MNCKMIFHVEVSLAKTHLKTIERISFSVGSLFGVYGQPGFFFWLVFVDELPLSFFDFIFVSHFWDATSHTRFVNLQLLLLPTLTT